FTAAPPTTRRSGEASTLSWHATRPRNGQGIQFHIDAGANRVANVNAEGKLTVRPTDTTTYTLTASVRRAQIALARGTGTLADPINTKYTELGGPGGRLGAPTGLEMTAPDGVGLLRNYAHGSIYWTPETGAHAVFGPVLQKWSGLGREAGLLGYPATDVTA